MTASKTFKAITLLIFIQLNSGCSAYSRLSKLDEAKLIDAGQIHYTKSDRLILLGKISVDEDDKSITYSGRNIYFQKELAKNLKKEMNFFSVESFEDSDRHKPEGRGSDILASISISHDVVNREFWLHLFTLGFYPFTKNLKYKCKIVLSQKTAQEVKIIEYDYDAKIVVTGALPGGGPLDNEGFYIDLYVEMIAPMLKSSLKLN